MKSVKKEILEFIKSIANDDLSPGPHMLVPCDLYDENLQTGFIIHKAKRDIEMKDVSRFQDIIVDEAEKAGFKLIQIWEDLWLSKKPIIQSRLMSVYNKTERVFARKTKISKIDKPVMDAFLEKNHLQGVANAAYKYGLSEGNRLVAVATFSKGRTIERVAGVCRSFELIRFCSLLNTTVVGGLDKLLKHFIREHQPDDIMTYADRDWSDGSVYENIGFEQVDITGPHKFWIDPKTGLRVFPNKIERLFVSKEWVVDKNSNVESILEEHGYLTAYNAGSLKYILMLKFGV